MKVQMIKIPIIKLKWSNWILWDELKTDERSGGIKIPQQSGVYEVRYIDSKKRLTIGKAVNLKRRIRQGLVKGKIKHSAGKRIRASEDISRILIRWAITDRPVAIEEELHKRYLTRFGEFPKHTKRT